MFVKHLLNGRVVIFGPIVEDKFYALRVWAILYSKFERLEVLFYVRIVKSIL